MNAAPESPSRATLAFLGLSAGALLAVALPLLLTRFAVPDAVFAHQLTAVAGWGAWLLFGAELPRPLSPRAVRTAVAPAMVAVGLCAAFAAARIGVGQGAAVAVLLFAAVLVWRGAHADRRDVAAFAWAWWVAGMASVAISLVQYFAPSLADGVLVAASSSVGRAVGNVRQPNHLATALLCSIAMTTWLWQTGRLRRGLAAVSVVAMVFALALTASRTGALSLGVLVLWAALDRRLPSAARWTLALTPLAYGAFWSALAVYAEWQHAHFYAADRLQSGSDISSSRFAIWRNAMTLLAQNPWTGVGWGNFNFAWTLSPFPDRPVAFFDHTHNLPLQLAVEIGLPATLAVLGLVGYALWRARAAVVADEAAGTAGAGAARAALAMLALLAVHSQLEYPLWYAYFLLPGAWALGLFLGIGAVHAGRVTAAHASPGAPSAGRGAAAQQVMGALMLVAAAYAGWDHRRIELIFAPPANAAPLEARIAAGQRSLLFGHHADYAAVTSEPRDTSLAAFRRPLHQLIDVRLLAAYMTALKANGRDAEARYAAQRLREFKREDAQAYFEDCTADNPAPPWLCDEAPVAMDWRALDR